MTDKFKIETLTDFYMSGPIKADLNKKMVQISKYCFNYSYTETLVTRINKNPA